MARCRVYLFTYKRNNLLPRAVKSLLAQTFNDWICEVHNDCPGDNFPGDYIRSLCDPRFLIRDHPVNLGGTASFNLAFAGCEEQYASILEDDNWWEPRFLDEMISTLDTRTDIDIAWSNMRIWKEQPGGEWTLSGNTWPDDGEDVLFQWPHEQQAFGALHSTGAMLYRGKNAANYQIPGNCIQTIVEGVRERCFKFPVLLKKELLANFALTSETYRPSGRISWAVCQVLLLGSFISGSMYPEKTFGILLEHHRQRNPSPVPAFFLTVVLILKKYRLLTSFTARDWLITGRWLLRNGHGLGQVSRLFNEQRASYAFMLYHTRAKNQFIPPVIEQ